MSTARSGSGPSMSRRWGRNGMADLLDIAPSAAVAAVTIAGAAEPIDVRRLKVDEIAALAKRFPLVLAMFVGGLEAAQLPGEALAAIIAAGCDHIGDAAAEAKVGLFLIEDQFTLADAILGLTFPNGLVPAVAAFENLARHIVGAAEPAKVVKMRSAPSPSPSPPSSDAVSRRTM